MLPVICVSVCVCGCNKEMHTFIMSMCSSVHVASAREKQRGNSYACLDWNTMRNGILKFYHVVSMAKTAIKIAFEWNS